MLTNQFTGAWTHYTDTASGPWTDHMVESFQSISIEQAHSSINHTIYIGIRVRQQVTEPKLSFSIVSSVPSRYSVSYADVYMPTVLLENWSQNRLLQSPPSSTCSSRTPWVREIMGKSHQFNPLLSWTQLQMHHSQSHHLLYYVPRRQGPSTLPSRWLCSC